MAEGEAAQPKRRRLLQAMADLPSVQPLPPASQTNQQPNAPAAADKDPDLDDIPLPSDVEAAILFLRQEAAAPQVASGKGGGEGGGGLVVLPPLVLVSQLHSMVKDRRIIDGELEELRRKNRVRSFKLSTGVDEHGLLLTSDYLRVIHEAVTADQAQCTQQQQQDEDGRQHPAAGSVLASGLAGKLSVEGAIVELFCTNVIPNHNEVSIAQTRLLALLRFGANPPLPAAVSSGTAAGGRPGPATAAANAPVQTAAGVVTADMAVCVLLQLGVLARHSIDDGSFLFCCPRLGPVIKSILGGRKEVLAFISKKPRTEVSEKALLGNTLNQAIAIGSTGRGTGGGGSAGLGRAFPTEGGFLRPLEIDLGEGFKGEGNQGKGKKGRGKKEGEGGVSAGVGGRVAAARTPGLKLRQSVFGVRYHVHDLLGRGDVVRVQSTSGDLIKIADKGGQGRGG